MNPLLHLTALSALLLLLCPAWAEEESVPETFWPAEAWVFATPRDEGMDQSRLEEALNYARDSRRLGVVVARHGRIVAERYWEDWKAESTAPVGAVTESITSLLLALVMEEGLLLGLDQKVSDILTEWKGTPRDGVLFRHILAQTSGLDERPTLVPPKDRHRKPEQFGLNMPLAHKPGLVWKVNQTAGRLLLTVLARATGTAADRYATDKLFKPLGMACTRWQKRKVEEVTSLVQVESSCRDLARLGLFVLRQGLWNGLQLLPRTRVAQLTRRSQEINPAYGHLWWCNGSGTHMAPGSNRRRKGPLFPNAPPDCYAALSRRHARIYVIPSLDLIITTLGEKKIKDHRKIRRKEFDDRFLSLVVRAMEKKTAKLPPPPPDPDPRMAQFRAKLAELHTARRQGDIETFRRVAAEIQEIWAVLPRELRREIERSFPGISRRIAEGFE